MRIISHRGYWKLPEERNTQAAFTRTLAAGFGTETDVRDAGGRLVVAHDPATGHEVPWSEVVDAFEGTRLPLAVNIKADGIAPLIAEAFEGRNVEWFAFDMSVPETVRYRDIGLPYFTRHSELEMQPVLYEEAKGVWLDAFSHTWFDLDTILRHIQFGKHVCVVSSELHGRNPEDLWRMIKPLAGRPDVLLCTDQPEAARESLSL